MGARPKPMGLSAIERIDPATTRFMSLAFARPKSCAWLKERAGGFADDDDKEHGKHLEGRLEQNAPVEEHADGDEKER